MCCIYVNEIKKVITENRKKFIGALSCDEDVIKRYRKYIYMYLDKIFNKDDKVE